jgi:hypothetical protein
MGLIIGFVSSPPGSGVSDIADDGLASGMDMHMLNSHSLTAATSQLSESLCMLPADPEELQSHVAIALQHRDVLRPSDTGQKRHGKMMGGSDLYSQQSLHFILRSHT